MGHAQNGAIEKKIDSLIQYTKSIWYSDAEEALQMADIVLALSREHDYLKGEASGNNLLGVIYSIKGDFAQSMLYYKKGADLFREIADFPGIASCQYNMGLLLQDDGQYQEALKYVNEAYSYHLESGNRYDIAMAGMTLGNLYLTNNKGLNAVSYTHLTLPTTPYV